MKSFIWKQYTVQITKKNVKNTNVRIKRDHPHVILMSIPYSAPYKAFPMSAVHCWAVEW